MPNYSDEAADCDDGVLYSEELFYLVRRARCEETRFATVGFVASLVVS